MYICTVVNCSTWKMEMHVLVISRTYASHGIIAYTHMPITIVDDGHHSDQGMAIEFIVCWRRLFLTTG
jgi:hypothetical protein